MSDEFTQALTRLLNSEKKKRSRPGLKLRVVRERLNRGGYTSRGQYFGVGEPLWSYDAFLEGQPGSDDYERTGHMRAPTKAEARAKIIEFLRLSYNWPMSGS